MIIIVNHILLCKYATIYRRIKIRAPQLVHLYSVGLTLALFIVGIALPGLGNCDPHTIIGSKPGTIYENKTPIIIDTDAAEDDWVAILYLLSRSDIDIKAITVVGTGETKIDPGIQHVGDLTVLAQKQNIPIFSQPNQNTVVNYNPKHNFPIKWLYNVNNGQNLPTLNSDAYKKANISKKPAAIAIANIIKSSKTPVDIVTLGPLTNIDNAFKQMQDKDIKKIGKIYIMGGAYYRNGNLRKNAHLHYANNTRAEWNVFADPVAFDDVFTKLDRAFPSSLSKHAVLVPLDTTNYLPITSGFYEKLVKMHKQFPDNKILGLYFDIMSTSFVQGGITNNWYDLFDPATALIAVMDQNGDLVKYPNTEIQIPGFWVATNSSYPDCIGATIPVGKQEPECPVAKLKRHGNVNMYLPSQKMIDSLFDELLGRIADYESPGQAQR